MANNDSGPPGLRVRLIGELELSDAAGVLPLPASRKTRALFVYLMQMRRPVRRERLCELFFDIPDDPRAALRWSLSKLRATLGRYADILVADRERVELVSSGITTDVDQLRHWLGGTPLPGSVSCHGESVLEAPLPGLELNNLDSWNAWLAAERADIDQVRAKFLHRVAQEPDLTPEQRALYVQEAGTLHVFPAPLERTGPVPQPANDPITADAPPPQHIRYCFADDGVGIAFATTGEGPPLVKAANWLNHLELDWQSPVWGRMFTELSQDRMLVRYDERGNGLSDWDAADLSFEAFVRDLETVADSLGLERFPLLGISQG